MDHQQLYEYACTLFDAELTVDEAVDKAVAELSDQDRAEAFPIALRSFFREARGRRRAAQIASFHRSGPDQVRIDTQLSHVGDGTHPPEQDTPASNRNGGVSPSGIDTLTAEVYSDPRRIVAAFLRPERTLAECTAEDVRTIVDHYRDMAAANSAQAVRYQRLADRVDDRGVATVGDLSAGEVAEVLS